jgi:ubiquinone/menaquinone biosynthesis C-methylase UbiE
MLKVAGRKLRSFRDAGHLELVQADVQAYLEAQPDNSYDRIISVNVLYAIADQTALWKELMRVLSPNGAIIATTSVRPGSGPIIKEHFEHSSVWVLLRPRLIGVFLIDALINIFGHTGHFAFPDEAKLRKAVAASGASWVSTDVCYGGPQNGVNILFEVTHQPGA